MCGIVGVAGNLNNNDIKIFKELLFVDTLRGRHATGMYAYSAKKNEGELVKKAMEAPSFLELKQVDKLCNISKSLLLGHNRHATIGNLSGVNAHPFQYQDIVGVHNGSISIPSFTQLKNKFKNPDYFQVDSDAIFANIQHFGIEDTLKEMQGAWCLVWVNLEEQTLNFLRNEKRPMTLYRDEGDLYWASEVNMLRAILSRNKIEWDPSKVTNLPVNTLFSYDISPVNKSNIISVGEPKITVDMKGKEEVKTIHETSQTTFIGRSKTNYRAQSRQQSTKVESPIDPIEFNSFLKYEYDGVTLIKTSFKKDCCYCSNPVDSKDNWVWLSPDTILCENCCNDKQVRGTIEEYTGKTLQEFVTEHEDLLYYLNPEMFEAGERKEA